MAVPPPQSQPPALMMDELLEEILFRLPSDKPAQLVRAAMVCKRWYHLVMDPGFRRQFWQFHRTPPIGLIVRLYSPATITTTTSSFLPTSCFYPYDAGCRTCSPLDARHGRILFYDNPVRSNPATNELNVWTPATGDMHKLPRLWLPCSSYSYWNAALLCRTPDCNHTECPSDGPFTVVLVGGNTFSLSTHAYVYSSEADEWSEAASIEDPRYVQHHCTYSALVGNALYFLLRCNSGILEYDLAKKELSVIVGLPPICKVSTAGVLVSVEDHGLGFAMVHDDCSLCIWLRESAPTPSGGSWTPRRVVDLKNFLPVSALLSPSVIGAAADAVGVFIIRAGRDDGGVLAVDLKSGHLRKACGANGYIVNMPYISFCTPALRAAAIDEGPSMGASNT